MGNFLAAAVIVGAIHFAIPLAYYVYLRRYVHRSWNLKLNSSYIPRTTVMIPTFNESTLIAARLENIKLQLFPKDNLDVIVVDSGSTDGTTQNANDWILRNSDPKVMLIREGVRQGKAYALNTGLKHASGDIVVITDADAKWSETSLSNAAAYFSDSQVGAVTGVKQPIVSSSVKNIESVYRYFFNTVRVAESKIHSTPVFNGELAAFRKDLLKEVGGFQVNIGADDSHAASLLSLRGFRSIAVPDVAVFELAPRSWSGYLKWKRRRALHLVQHFKVMAGKIHTAPKGFRDILMTETFLHVINPWLLAIAIAAFVASVVTEGFSLYHLAIILLAGACQIPSRSRKALGTWIVDQLILVYASLSGLFSSELVWPKIQELRTQPAG